MGPSCRQSLNCTTQLLTSEPLKPMTKRLFATASRFVASFFCDKVACCTNRVIYSYPSFEAVRGTFSAFPHFPRRFAR
jgi:hypothetical protein